MVYFKVARAFCFITAFDSSTVRCVFAFVFLQVVFLFVCFCVVCCQKLSSVTAFACFFCLIVFFRVCAFAFLYVCVYCACCVCAFVFFVVKSI